MGAEFNALSGSLGKYMVGSKVPQLPPHSGGTIDAIRANISRVSYPHGFVYFITEDLIVDAVGVVKPYSDQLLGCCRIGDSIAHLFVNATGTAKFAATFIEYVDSALYFFTESNLGISVHAKGIPFEDGPFEKSQWLEILDGAIDSVFVSHHENKRLAY